MLIFLFHGPPMNLKQAAFLISFASVVCSVSSQPRHRYHVLPKNCHGLKIHIADSDDVDVNKSCNGISGSDLWTHSWTADPGYASEFTIINTFLHRASVSNPHLYTNSSQEADIVIVAHCGVAAMHWHGHINRTHGPTLRLELTTTPILAEKQKKYPVSKHQSVAFVNAHDAGRGVMPPQSQQYISIQHNGDYGKDFIVHNTIVTVPFGNINSTVFNATARKNAAFFAGSIIENNLDYSWGLRQHGAKLYGANQSQFVVYHTNHVPNYAEQIQKYRYCLYLPGWVGWSGRLFHILNAACVPVFVLDRTMLPFENRMKWSELALFLSEQEFMEGALPALIQDISDETYEIMFTNLVELRSHWFIDHNQDTPKRYSDAMGSLLEEELCQIHKKRKHVF